MSNFVDDMANHLKSSGLRGTLISASLTDDNAFGDTEAVFSVGKLLLRFVRERGQIFLEVATRGMPNQFHQFDDIEIAMGWETLSEILNNQMPDNIGEVIERLAKSIDQLENDLSGEHGSFTKKRIERATRMRGEAFVESLRAIATKRSDD